MADNQLLLNNGVGGDNDIFVYTGGEQQVPRDVKRVRIAENVDTIAAWTFHECEQLIEVEGHNKIKKVEEFAFDCCTSLRSVSNLTGLKEIEQYAFDGCSVLSDIDFDKLEIIGHGAFIDCDSIPSVNMPSIRRVGACAFQRCGLTDVVFGERLDRIEEGALRGCRALRRITIPLKDNLIVGNEVFHNCENLSSIDILDEGIHETISSLHLESWRDEMKNGIDRINQTLPNIRIIEKTGTILRWFDSVLQRMEHYKSEHQTLLKEAMALLELALWKAKIEENVVDNCYNLGVITKRAKIDDEAARKEHRVTCGASIVIKNVLPFLALK